MVLESGSTSSTETPPVNPPQSSLPSPPILSAASFYLMPQGSTPTLNFPTTSFRWNNNHQYYNFFPTYPSLNPVQPWVQPSNQPWVQPQPSNHVEPLNFPILRYGSSPSLPDNLGTNLGLRLGLSPNPSDNYFSENLRTNTGLRLGSGSETNRDENRTNPTPRFGSETNRAEDSSIPILRFGSNPSFPNTLRSNQAFRFGSETNREENRTNSGFVFGSEANRTENKTNPVFVFGSEANRNENGSNPLFGFGSSSNRHEELGHLFRRIGTTLNIDENRTNQVSHFGSSPNPNENVGFIFGSNRVQNNEANNTAWANLMLESARAVTPGLVDEHVEVEQNLGLEEKGKSSAENGGGGGNDGDGDGSDDDESDAGNDSEGEGEGDGDGDGDEEEADARGKGKEAAGEDEEAKEEGEGDGDGDEAEEPLVKTWNLRPRKPATKPQNLGGRGRSRSDQLLAKARARPGKPRPQGLRAVPPRASAEEKKPKFSISLTKEEIEADFLKMTGEKPPKKPSKRPKNVQKQLDMSFPGLWLDTVTPEMYQVPDPPLKA